MKTYSKTEIVRLIEEEDVEFIRLQFTDIFGVMKNIAVPANKLDKVLEGRYSIDVAILGSFKQGEKADLYLRPDLGTFTILPWRPQQRSVARFLCDVCNEDGTEYEVSSRNILKRAVEKATEKGYTLEVNPECEFFLFHTDDNGMPTTVTHEKAGYLDTSPIDLGENARRDIILALGDMGYDIDSSHHEISPAQHEIDFSYEGALETADKIMTFKTAVRTIAKRYGLHATFMPKPRMDVNGSGMHLYIRLYKDKKNILKNENNNLSADGKAFMAGILYHIQGMTAICNPLVNSYKRLIPGFEAPSEVTWSRSQRNALMNIRKKRGESLELELRSPDSAANPYLMFALCLAAGMDGIEKKMELPKELTENIRKLSEDEKKERGIVMLPENLSEALHMMMEDALVTETLGKEFADSYVRAKEEEWKEYLMQVSEWEIQKYLYLI